MFKLDGKKVIAAVIPFFILILAWILAMGTLYSNQLNAVLVTLPYVLAFFSLVLSVWFQHSRTFYAICILVITMAVVPSVEKLNQRALINGISLFIPIAFIILALVTERGITSKYGLIKGVVFLLSFLFILLDAGQINPWLERMKPAGMIFAISDQAISIPRLSVFLFILCLCILITRSFILTFNMEMAFIGVTLGSFVILHFMEYPDVLAIFFSAVFLIFIIALFQTSYSLAFHDTLTGVLSRRALEQEIMRLGNKYAIAMVDIDHFKRVNDKYGHGVGDDVLKMVAAMIERNAVGGKIFRYGGEEFVVVFPRKNAEEIIDLMDQVRIQIEKRPFILRSQTRPKKKPKSNIFRESGSEKIRITVSAGIADKNDRLQSAWKVIEAADKALYQAKKNGRNCVVH